MKLSDIFHAKKWIAAWAIFLIIFVLLFIWVSYLLRPLGANRENVAGYYAEPNDSLDMVYVGGSACFVYWMPYEAWDQYGITSYDFAYNGIPAESVLPSIKEVLKTQDPSLLVIDARPFQYRDVDPLIEVYVRNFADSINYSWDRLRYLQTVVPNELTEGEENNFWDYLFDISKYHTLWKNLTQQSWEYSFNRKINPYKGFYFNDVTYWNIVSEPAGLDTTTITPPSDETNELLQSTLDYCETLDCDILFVVCPFSEVEQQKAINNYVEQEITKRGFDFLDANEHIEEMKLDYSTDFYNKDHVNVLGAEKYTAFLGRYIQEHYMLPDRRQDPDYNSWNEEYPIWEQTLEGWRQTIKDAIASGNSAP